MRNILCGLFLTLLYLNWNGVKGQGFNQPPSFSPGGDLSKFSVPEDTPIGSVVYRLKGTDPENGELTYSISGEYFRVSKTGDLTLVKKLDRETDSSILVIISLTDDGQGGEPTTVSLRREISVLDRNDNPPVFENRPYAFKVSERTQVGTTVFSEISITDRDFKSNAEVTLTCADDETPIACETFSVTAERVGDGSYVGIITLLVPLDYEEHQAYAMTLRATDGLNTETALIAITVLDVQDQPPTFFGAPYVFRVKENTAPGVKIGDISVQDGDTGNPRDLQLRLIDEFQNNYFRLREVVRDPYSGVFSAAVETTENILDAEDDFVRANLGVYELVLEAREIPRGPDDKEPTLVTRKGLAVVVEDLDDYLPTFSPSVIDHVLRIPYNVDEAWVFPDFSVEIEDADVEAVNSIFTLQFEWSLDPSQARAPPEEVFAFITPSNDNPTIQSKGVITMEVTNCSLLQPGSTFDLIIAVFQNEHLVNKLNIPIEVAPGPKILPVFNQTVYRAAVPESISPGEIITRIAARNHEYIPGIKYNLIGVGADRFNVDEDMGIIRCGRVGCLDYERDKSHFFLVRAKSGPGVDEEVFVLFYLDVVETNDNPPVFESDPSQGVASKNSGGGPREIRRSVPDGTFEFDPPFFVRAKDSDINDRITYTLEDLSVGDSGIGIDSETGQITLERPLRWEESGEHRLIVTASDRTGKVSHQPVLLIVQAVQNLPPTFPFKVMILLIEETLPLGSSVFKLVGHDPDGQDSELKYDIVSQPEPDLFNVEERSGVVRLGGKLDFEEKLRTYPLIVRVRDEGKPSESETAILEVNIKDVNDEAPKFTMKNFVVEMSESAKPDDTIIQLTAEDMDDDAELEYDISCDPCQVWDASGSLLNKEDAHEYFQNLRVNPTTGEVTLVNPMEHKKSSAIEFQGHVRDTRGVFGVQNDTTTVTLYISAAERNTPIFGHPWTLGNPWINLTIPEDIEIGSTVVTLNAWDYIADETISEFRLEDSDMVKEFSLDGNELKVEKVLDYEIKDQYILAVRAIDKRGGESVANLKITISDINDHEPVFSKPEYKGKVAENSEYPVPILTVEASDRDDPSNYGAIRYALIGPQAHLFTIDPLAGVVQVAPGADLDRERDSSHSLYVLAVDTPNGGPFQRTATALLSVQVTDLNDVDPICRESQELLVPENSPVGLHFGNVTCIDPDLDPKHVFTLRDDSKLGLFAIEANTGKLTVAKSLQGRGRTAPYLVAIIVEDGKERTVSITLPIKVANVIPNDGKPRFTNDNFTVAISEGAQRNSPVLLVKAEDSDSFDNGEGRLSYLLMKQTYPCHSKLAQAKADGVPVHVQDVDLFRLDEHTGLLSLRDSVDREKFECFSLLVSVEDFGTPPQGDTAWFEILVNDLDDSLPYLPLEQRNPEIFLNETMKVGETFYKLTSFDDDIFPNNQVTYEIAGGGNDLFRIHQTDHQNASLILNGDLSSMNTNELNLQVKCHPKDKRITVPECSSKIKVKILRSGNHINLNALERSAQKSGELILGVAADSPVGNLIGNLGMTKFDQTSEQIFHPNSYSMSPFNVSELFRIDSATGDIFVWDNLHEYKDGHLRVELSDRNSGLTRKNLKIFIAPNERLLSADTLDFGKVRKWVQEAGEILNKPDKQRRLTKGLFRLLTFDQTSANDGKTKICFQLLENENMVPMEKALKLLEQDELLDLFLKYSFDPTKKGCPSRPRFAAKLTYGQASIGGGRFWVERSLVGIASVVAIATISAILILCLVNRNKDRLKD